MSKLLSGEIHALQPHYKQEQPPFTIHSPPRPISIPGNHITVRLIKQASKHYCLPPATQTSKQAKSVLG